MLKNFSAQMMPEGFLLEEEIEKQRGLLFSNQMKIKENRLPVMVIFEGWGAAGKGSIIGKVIKDIDPRFFRVTNLSKITEEDKRYPFLYRYMKEIPEGGQFVFYDSFWM
jgi:polyphosphate kinase 2 (PPK2 family)